MALVLFGFSFIKNGRSLVLATDGLSQHAPIVGYYGEYLRTILRNIFVNHSFEIPMFDFSIGLGSDIVSTLHYYGLGDPLNLLYVFVPIKYTEYMYGVLCVLRMYLCGLGFSFFMLNRGRNVQAAVTGAIAYAFCGFSIMCTIAHPFFISGLMYCPLIFMGIDLILSKKSPVLYIISIALLISTNFYFAYMTCIMMLFYAALRFFELNKGVWKKTLAPTIGKFALYTINAFLIPMVIFLPQINNVLSTGRLNADNYVGVFYSPSYYATLLDSVTNPASNMSYSLLGFTGVSFLCIIVCFVHFRKHKNTAIGFLISIVAILFPVFGHIMNGFAYVTNRWSWIFSFIAAVAVSNCYDELFELENKEKKCYGLFVPHI